jgi:hypothetical protein
MSPDDTGKLVRRASEFFGHEELRIRLKVSRHVFDAWLAGRQSPPFTALLDLSQILAAAAVQPPCKRS